MPADDLHRTLYVPDLLVNALGQDPATVSIMMAECEWPSPPRFLSCTPLSHAGAAMFLPTLMKGGTMLVLPGFDPDDPHRAASFRA